MHIGLFDKKNTAITDKNKADTLNVSERANSTKQEKMPAAEAPEEITIKDLVDVTSSKSNMYRGLVMFGKSISGSQMQNASRLDIPAREEAVPHRLPQRYTHRQEEVLPK